MDDASNDPRVGSVVQGRYRILERMADGSMGVVYRAERLQLGRNVAIKFLHASYAADAQFIQRFERETKVMSRLSHPHCVSVIDFGVEGAPYVVMEFVSGRTLKSLIERGPLPVERALHITRQILGGLAHAHAQEIVHRDIKPANVMLTEATGTGDHVRILDFGLATLRGAHGQDLSQSQIVLGTPNYMSPEQTMAAKVDARSDLYSTAVVLFELLTGEKPFSADDTYELLLLHRSAPVPRLAERAPDATFPPELQAVLDKAMAKQPDERYGSAIEFADALEDATRVVAPDPFAIAPTVPVAPPPPPPPLPPPPLETGDSSGFAFAPTQAMTAEPEPRSGLGFFGTIFLLALMAGAGYGGYRLWQDRQEAARARSSAAAAGGEGAAAPVESPPGENSAETQAGSQSGSQPGVSAATPDAAPASPTAGALSDAGTAPAVVGAPDAAASDAGVGDPAADEIPTEPSLPPEEQEEPVAPVAEEAEADSAEPTTAAEAQPEPEPADPAPMATTARKPNPPDTVREAVALIKAGKREQAIRALLGLRKKMPRSAYVPYLLGNLYFDKRWWTVGIQYYRSAIAKNGLYRGKRILNQNVVRALGNGRTRRTAASLFLRTIKRSALPYLRRAARSDKNPEVRRQASYLVKRLSPKKKKKKRIRRLRF